MSVSAIFGTRIPATPSLIRLQTGVYAAPKAVPMIGGGGVITIECSSRPQKKATAHHMKTRPRKSQPWDIKRGPAVYPPLPPLPPDWTVVGTVSAVEADDASSDAPPPPQID